MNSVVLIQGEKISVSGTVTSGSAAYSLTGKKVIAIVKCLDNGTELILKSFDTSPRISISANTYSFNITPEETVKMAGNCTIEVAIVASDGPILPIGTPISFFLSPSYIGEYIAKNNITA